MLPEVIAKPLHDGLEHGKHVTFDQFRAGLAEVRAEIANLDTHLSTDIAGVRTELASLETRLIPVDGGHRHRDGHLDRRHPVPAWMTTSKPPASPGRGGDPVVDPAGAPQ